MARVRYPRMSILIREKYNWSIAQRSSFWPIGHRFDADLICMRKTPNCPLHTHIHGNGHQVVVLPFKILKVSG